VEANSTMPPFLLKPLIIDELDTMETDRTSLSNASDSFLPEDPEQSFQDVIEEFPSMRHAFAYGSGVFSQPGLYEKKSERAMIDFIFVVEKPASWHYKVSPLSALDALTLSMYCNSNTSYA
jgi:hypothetical protein